MKNISNCVGKYYVIDDNTYVYIFPGENNSRLRPDDMEMVYWTTYKIIGGGYAYNLKNSSGKAFLFYDCYGDATVKQMKPGTYKVIGRKDWVRGLVKTLFDPNFSGIINLSRDFPRKETESFYEGLKQI